MPIQLVVGLRNPGLKYELTRHNAGGWFLEALAKSCNTTFKFEAKMQAELTNLKIDGLTCRGALPTTFMNHSGLALSAICQFYRIPLHEVIVAHDDLDLPAGKVKLKRGGGHGGHNGLRDIMQQLGSEDFYRLRIGIGHPGHKDLVLNYVLGKPSQADRQLIDDAIARSISVLPIVLQDNLALAMNQLH